MNGTADPATAEQPFLLGGEWTRRGTLTELRSPWRNLPVARYWKGEAADLEAAIGAAAAAAPVIAALPSHRRAQVLEEVAAGLRNRREEIATRLMLEAGKPIRLARLEVDRAFQTFRCAAAEAGRIGGEWLSIDADPSGENKVGIVRRFPIGVVGAITPFNFPLNLVAHKIAPAIAAGNALVLKPASQTPLSALAIAALVHEAGWPAGGVNVVPCAGDVAFTMAADRRLALLSFTGSAEIGWRLEAAAGRKRVVLELGGNAAVIVNRDGDIERAAERCAAGGFQYAGQSCISVQRIFVHREAYGRFRDALIDRVKRLRVGDPADEAVDVGPVITTADAERIVSWVEEAVAAGARLLLGGGRDGAVVEPTVLENAGPAMKVSCREVFGPVVVLQEFAEFADAVRMVNESDFGLQAGVFTRDIGAIQYAHRTIEVGGLMVNEVPTFRVDHMPYGGVKDSGNGREGPRYAIEEMTEPRLLVLHDVDPL